MAFIQSTRSALVTWSGVLILGMATVGAAPSDVGITPDAAFLEFLGSWHTGDDRWVDPFELETEPDSDHSIHLDDQKSGQAERTEERLNSKDPVNSDPSRSQPRSGRTSITP